MRRSQFVGEFWLIDSSLVQSYPTKTNLVNIGCVPSEKPYAFYMEMVNKFRNIEFDTLWYVPLTSLYNREYHILQQEMGMNMLMKKVECLEAYFA